MSIDFVFRIAGLIIFAIVGWQIGTGIAGEYNVQGYMRWVLTLSLAGALLGLLITPYLTTRPMRYLARHIRQLPAQRLLAATIGLAIGLIIAALLALPLSLLPGYLGEFLPFLSSVFLGYSGAAILVMRDKEFSHLLANFLPGGDKSGERSEQIILDTSAIIDGRIADISQTGFIRGSLAIPRFVLNELQLIADSPDVLKRNRGRRGLDMLNRLQKESNVPIQILEADVDDVRDVDGKLVKIAKIFRCPIITNDYNLNRVAELQGVLVLNVNELANAVKSVVLPGEEMAVRIIQEGKELGQGVGYLEDGTMVVVEGGRRYLHNQLEIVVTRVLQTVAGRMIFAQPKSE